jgi:putative DNA-invertase from lambdoid prophage Rac
MSRYIQSMSRVGIYLRVSTSEQSTDLQRYEIEAYVKARGWALSKAFEDKLSGTTTKRPALQQLVAAARARQIDTIVCFKLDRMFRSLKDMVALLTELQELGVTFISIRDQIDLTTSSGRLMTHLIAAFAEFEASLIRERVCAGLDNARRKGVKLGRPKSIDTDKVVSMRLSGMSLAVIASELGVTKSAVSKTLSKSRYQVLDNIDLPKAAFAIE